MLGRPMIPRDLEEAILAHRASGLSYDAISIVTGASRATACRVVTKAAERDLIGDRLRSLADRVHSIMEGLR